MRTITIRGFGRVQRRPDTISIRMEVSDLDMEYEKAMGGLVRKVSSITAFLAEAGIAKDDIKTSSFDCDAEFGYENQKKTFRGYHVNQLLTLNFDLDMKVLSKVMAAIRKSDANPEINLSFVLKDKESVSEEVLASACKDARRKAEVILKATGESLGGLESVDYSFNPNKICSDTRIRCMSINEEASPEMDITPEDIDIHDTALFVWRIA